VDIYNCAQSNLIGGYTAAERNIISGNGWSGVALSDTNTDGNIIAGNYIGLDATGSIALSNYFFGVELDNGTSGNVIGGSAPGAGNVISGNNGVLIRNPGSSGNLVQGNIIGLNANGSAAFPNSGTGVDIYDCAQSNLIGGYTAAVRNIISGNGWSGVVLSDTNTEGNIIAGNFIGVNSTGALAVGNLFFGVELDNGTSGNIIGGSPSGAGNVISGNGGGVLIRNPGSSGNIVQGNYIGIDSTGMLAVANSGAGVLIYGGPQSNLLGGASQSSRNVISGNSGQGILISDAGTEGNLIQGNFIGLNAAGNAAIANESQGVEIQNGSQGNVVGGGVGYRNFISGNGVYGIAIHDLDTASNIIQGNSIGLDATSAGAMPNGWAGITVYAGATANQIGGTTPGAANLVAFNFGGGILLDNVNTTNNVVRGNSVFSNINTGLALYDGANLSAAAPALSTAAVSINTSASGSLTGRANTVYHVDFYANPAPASTAQAMTYLGYRDINTGAGGSTSFAVSLGALIPPGRVITATSTDPAGNTSALSYGVAVTTTSTVNDGIPDAWRAAYFGGNGATTNSQSCATCDPDHDGIDNLQKFLAGLNPTNATSILSFDAVSNNLLNNMVGFLSASGIVYRVESCDDLAGGTWLLLADQIVGTGTNIFIVDQGVSATGNRFYRLQVLW
jgi:titin